MAGSVNKVILIGNLGRDPEIRSFQNGGKVCNLRIATSENWRDKETGERKERTEWHNIVIDNDNLVKVVENYLKKGSKIYVEGSLRTRKWQDRDGNDRYTTEVYVGRFRGDITLLDGRSGGSGGSEFGGSARGGYADDDAAFGGSSRSGGGPAKGADFGGDFEDDVPF